MTTAHLYAFEDRGCTEGAIASVNATIQLYLKENAPEWKGQFGWHSTWAFRDTRITTLAAYNEASAFCCNEEACGIACFDFRFENVRVTDNHIAMVFDNGELPRGITGEQLKADPGLLLAWAMAKNPKADVIILLCTSNSDAQTDYIETLQEYVGTSKADSFGNSLPVRAQNDTLGRELVKWIAKFIKEYKPEQAIIDFFNWRRTKTTTTRLHDLDSQDLSTWRKANEFLALCKLLRMNDRDMTEVLSNDSIRQSTLESLKGMGGDNDSIASQRCSILGVFLIAWSAYRFKCVDDSKFRLALDTFSRSQDKKVERTYSVTKGEHSVTEMLSAFYVLLELATDESSRSMDQVKSIILDADGFKICFELGQDSVSNLKSAIDSLLGAVQAVLERKKNSSSSVISSLQNAGDNQTTRALLHHMLVARRRQYRDGCEECADFAVNFGDDEVVLHWYPKS